MKRPELTDVLHSAAATLLIEAERDKENGQKLQQMAAELQIMAFERTEQRASTGG